MGAQEREVAQATGPLSASHSSRRSLSEPPWAEASAQRGQLLTTIKGCPPPACQRSFVNSTASTASEQDTGTSTVTSADEERLWLLSPCEPASEWSPSGTRLGEDEEIGTEDKTAQQERENDVEKVESSTHSVASAGGGPSSASLEMGVHELVSLSGDIEKRRQATGCCNLVFCDDAEMKDADTPQPNVDCGVSCRTSVLWMAVAQVLQSPRCRWSAVRATVPTATRSPLPWQFRMKRESQRSATTGETPSTRTVLRTTRLLRRASASALVSRMNTILRNLTALAATLKPVKTTMRTSLRRKRMRPTLKRISSPGKSRGPLGCDILFVAITVATKAFNVVRGKARRKTQ